MGRHKLPVHNIPSFADCFLSQSRNIGTEAAQSSSKGRSASQRDRAIDIQQTKADDGPLEAHISV